MNIKKKIDDISSKTYFSQIKAMNSGNQDYSRYHRRSGCRGAWRRSKPERSFIEQQFVIPLAEKWNETRR